MTITGADERIHPVEQPGPEWADAVTWTVWDRSVGLVVVARLAVLPNAPGAEASVLAWLAGRPAYVFGHRSDEVPLADWDDLEVAGLRLVEVEPLEAWELSLADGDNLASLRFDATAAARRQADGAGGYEQVGRLRGQVRLAGRDVPVEGAGHRAHAWGPLRPPAQVLLGFLDDGGWFRSTEAVTSVSDDGRTIAARVVLDDGEAVDVQGYAHGLEIAAAGDGRAVVRTQPTRFATEDGRDGYGIVQRSEANDDTEEAPCA